MRGRVGEAEMDGSDGGRGKEGDLHQLWAGEGERKGRREGKKGRGGERRGGLIDN